MTPLQIIALIGTVASSLSELAKLFEQLHAQGHPLDAPIPAEHQARANDLVSSVQRVLTG